MDLQTILICQIAVIDEPAPIRRSSVIVFDNLRVYYFGSLEYTFKGHEDFCLRFLNSQGSKFKITANLIWIDADLNIFK